LLLDERPFSTNIFGVGFGGGGYGLQAQQLERLRSRRQQKALSHPSATDIHAFGPGSKISAKFIAAAPIDPPATKILPSANRVAECALRAMLIGGAFTNAPVTTSCPQKCATGFKTKKRNEVRQKSSVPGLITMATRPREDPAAPYNGSRRSASPVPFRLLAGLW
jgi:hypothetical protein